MSNRVSSLVAQIVELQEELEREFAKRRDAVHFSLEHGRITFTRDVLSRHKRLKTSLLAYLRTARPLVLLTAPVIYSVGIPLLLLDLFVTIYQAACFPVYGIPKVSRRDHFAYDRHRLGYLNLIEKLNCLYCSYANGLISYVREIAARTEQYWCPIKHARKLEGIHSRYPLFVDYGDADDFAKRQEELRVALRENAGKSHQ
ncbi:MAG: hypothetical protein AB7O39_10685 [Flavobacteriaceae bacterium]